MVYCRIIDGAIPESLCSDEQGQKGCRYCLAKTRRCLGCGQSSVVHSRFGLCDPCYVKGKQMDYCISCLARPKKTGEHCSSCADELQKQGFLPVGVGKGNATKHAESEFVDDQAVVDFLEEVRDEVEPEEAIRPSRWKQYELEQARIKASVAAPKKPAAHPSRPLTRSEVPSAVQPAGDLPLFRRILATVCGTYGVNPGKLFKPKRTGPLLEVELAVLYCMFLRGESFKTSAEQARVTEDEARQAYRTILREKSTNAALAGKLAEIERQLGGH